MRQVKQLLLASRVVAAGATESIPISIPDDCNTLFYVLSDSSSICDFEVADSNQINTPFIPAIPTNFSVVPKIDLDRDVSGGNGQNLIVSFRNKTAGVLTPRIYLAAGNR